LLPLLAALSAHRVGRFGRRAPHALCD